LVSGTQAASSVKIMTPDQLHWSSKGLPSGMSMAALTGDPGGTGMYVYRLKMAPGSVYLPHVHGKAEMVTVLSGTLMAGIGSKMNKSAMKPLTPGTFVVIQPGTPHYVMAKDAVVIDVSGMGPSTTKMLGGKM
ncbi:MAG: cupin domain-containing protein, partial [Candidatus Baltobacteraceae bacterium]